MYTVTTRILLKMKENPPPLHNIKPQSILKFLNYIDRSKFTYLAIRCLLIKIFGYNKYTDTEFYQD